MRNMYIFIYIQFIHFITSSHLPPQYIVLYFYLAYILFYILFYFVIFCLTYAICYSCILNFCAILYLMSLYIFWLLLCNCCAHDNKDLESILNLFPLKSGPHISVYTFILLPVYKLCIHHSIYYYLFLYIYIYYITAQPVCTIVYTFHTVVTSLPQYYISLCILFFIIILYCSCCTNLCTDFDYSRYIFWNTYPWEQCCCWGEPEIKSFNCWAYDNKLEL